MGNCIVTKFNESINNSDLPVIGQLNARIDVGESFKIRPLDGKTVHISSPVNLYTDRDGGGINKGKEFDVDSSATVVLYTNSDIVQTIKITSKYDIRLISDSVEDYSDLMYTGETPLISYFYGQGGAGYGNLDTFKEYGRANKNIMIYSEDSGTVLLPIWKHSGDMSNLVYADIYCTSGRIRLILGADTKANYAKGNTAWIRNARESWRTYTVEVYAGIMSSEVVTTNVEDFADCINLEKFDMAYNHATGNLATGFGHAVKLDYINLGVTSAGHVQAEDLSVLFNALHTNGKTSGELTVIAGLNKTLNGAPWINGKTVTFTASGWSVNS